MPKPIDRLKSLISREALRQLAGGKSFERGEDYFDSGAVENLRVVGDAIEAKVRGEELYRVRLRVAIDTSDDLGEEMDADHVDDVFDDSEFDEVDEDEATGAIALAFSCSCPYGRDGHFCKHLVATGLAFLAGEIDDAATALPDLRAYLAGLAPERLVELLLSQCEVDERLRRRLEADAARTVAKGAGVDVAQWKRTLRQAAHVSDFISYREMYDYAGGVEEVIEAIEGLLADGHAAAVIELADYGLELVEDVTDRVDDSDGHMGGLMHQLQDLHLAACEKAPPDRRLLAEQLFHWETTSGYGIFSGAVTTYGDILGDEGRARYRELAETEWQNLPALSPGDKEEGDYNLRYSLSRVMRQLARASGDFDELIAVMSHDLSSPYSFLEIAKACEEQDRNDLALEWVERGWQAFPDRHDGRLRDFLVDAYHRRGRHDEALQMVWQAFEEVPSLALYAQLHATAAKAGQWMIWREHAMALIRRGIAAETQEAKGRKPAFWQSRAAASLLVEVHLHENDIDAAWREAGAGGCREGLWLELAGRREPTHPRDAIAVYRAHVERLLQHAAQRNYQESVTYLGRIERLCKGLGKDAEFRALLVSIRAANKRRPNFIKLIDAKGW